MKNGIIKYAEGNHGWNLWIVSRTKNRKHYQEKGIPTKLEAAHAYLKAVKQYDPATAETLKGKTIDEQFELLNVKL